MGKYQRMTFEVRCQIQAYMQAGYSVPQVADLVGFNKSSLYRELSRNTPGLSYSPDKATRISRERRKRQGRKLKIKGRLEGIIIDKLMQGWSPEQIKGRLASETDLMVSPQTVYSYIERNSCFKLTLRRTRQRGRGRYSQRRNRWSKRLHISKRPEIANNRGRIGDWERDAMYGANRQQLLVCTDRRSKYTKISKIKTLTSRWVSLETKKLLISTGKPIHTITNDNGTEFRGCTDIGVPIYYCTPMTPQQRGTVENTVGLLRQFITRRTNLSSLNDEHIQQIEDLINHRPRKGLDYKTPYEVFYGKSVALVS